jgi:hypothetical protein
MKSFLYVEIKVRVSIREILDLRCAPVELKLIANTQLVVFRTYHLENLSTSTNRPLATCSMTTTATS